MKNRKIEINFTGGDISSDGGVLLLKEADKRLCLLEAISKTFRDNRDPKKIKHDVLKLLKQRIYGIALGYEDLNDHDKIRKCLAFQTSVGVVDYMASSATLCRWENKANRETAVRMHKVMIDKFIDSYQEAPSELILDFDATDNEIHGNQEGRFFHGYYGHYCFLPLYVFCGKKLLVAYLRGSNKDAAKHSWAILSLLTKLFREAWPNVKIIFRGDSGFCRHKMFDWCDRHNVGYIVGISQNNILNKILEPTMYLSRETYRATGEKQRNFTEFFYKPKTWLYERKIIGKAEINHYGENPRYIVTNLEGSPKELYENLYCGRGNMENCIKEQLELFSDRTSSHNWWPNQFRLILSGLAYVLVEFIRDKFLKGTEFMKSQISTIRLKLFKIGAVIIRNTRRIRFLLSSSYPYQSLWKSLFRKLSLE